MPDTFVNPVNYKNRTALQRHNRAMNKANSCYRDWQMSEAGSRRARRLHRNYNRYLSYLHALEKAHDQGM